MKYGETLRQRSVPQWAYQNVAYDSIKRLIKEHTTPGKGKAVSIPGQSDKVDTHFENELFDVLVDQHANVNLFVRSKSGEIERRLDHLSRQLHNLQLTSWPPSVTPTRIPPSRLAKYGRIEEQALQAGEEIKLLSRYVTAQRTAFIKLLKKYKKWSGRTNLDIQWQSEVLSSPESFTHFELEPFLNQWTELLHEIRFAMGVGQAKSSTSTSATLSPAIHALAPKQSSVAVSRRIHDTLAIGSDVDFDSVLASSPLGSDGARAAYWVHPEQLVELQVLLLQHTRLAFSRSPPSTATGSSPSVTRRSSFSTSRRDSAFDREPAVGMIILDDPEEFPQLQNSLPIGDAEDSHSLPPSEPSITMRWVGTGDIAVTLKSMDYADTSEIPKPPVKIRPKHVTSFLQTEKPFTPSNTASGTDTPNNANSAPEFSAIESVKQIRTWLSQHKGVQPLVGFSYKRTRFTSLPSGRDRGQWCTLDVDIKMKKISSKDIQGKEWQQTFANSAIPFPYALLRVRQEGRPDMDLIRLLDESHLTERVRGFSLAAHALWTCCRPRSMTPPFWLPVLSGDIRKIPVANGKSNSRRPSNRPDSAIDGEDLATSSTAVSTADTSISTKRSGRTNGKNRMVRYASGTNDSKKNSEMSQVNQTKYWNEYDNPEDSGSEAGYYIYVNPEDDESLIPFKNIATAVYKWFRGLITKEKSIPQDLESQNLLRAENIRKDALYEARISEVGSSTTSDSDESDSDDDDYLRPRTHYGTLPVSQPLAHSSTSSERFGILLASTIALFFATVLSTVLLILSAVGRKRDRGEVDVVVLTGIIITIFSATGGLWGLVRNGIGSIRAFVAVLVFVVVVIVDGLLAGKLIRDF